MSADNEVPFDSLLENADPPEPGVIGDPDLGVPGDAEPQPDFEPDMPTQVNDEDDDADSALSWSARRATSVTSTDIRSTGASRPQPTRRCCGVTRPCTAVLSTGSFRTLCHLDKMDRIARRKYGTGIVVIQSAYNSTVAASAGTHNLDCCLDVYIPGVSWWEQQRFFRANGFACWYRHPPSFGNHIHGFTLPPREGRSISDDYQVHGFEVGLYVDGGYSTRGGLVTSSQIADYYNEAFGLSGQHVSGSDDSWYPPNIEATIFDLNKFIKARQHQADKLAAA